MQTMTTDMNALRRGVIESFRRNRFVPGWQSERVTNGPDDPALGTFTAREPAAFAWLLGIEAEREDTPFDRDELRHLAADMLDFVLDEANNRDGFSPFVMKCAPFAYRHLTPHVDRARTDHWLAQIKRGGEYFLSLDRNDRAGTWDWINFRTMELEAFIELARITGEQRWTRAAHDYVDALVPLQYPCGAVPYHTGMWMWGRRPAIVYACLAYTGLGYAAHVLGRDDAKRYVIRGACHLAMVCDTHGTPLTPVFESTKKGRRSGVEAGLTERPLEVAHRWLQEDPGLRDALNLDISTAEIAAMWAAVRQRNQALLAHPERLRAYGACLLFNEREQFDLPEISDDNTESSASTSTVSKRSRWRIERDISTAIINEGDLTAAATMLGGMNAPLSAQWGELAVLGAAPEVTDAPVYDNFGINCIDRTPWDQNIELTDAHLDGHALALRGRVPSRYEKPTNDDSTWRAVPLEITFVARGRRLLLAVRPNDAQLVDLTRYHFILMLDSITHEIPLQGRPVTFRIGDQTLTRDDAAYDVPAGPIESAAGAQARRVLARMLSPQLETIRIEPPIPTPEVGVGVDLPRYEATAWRFRFDADGTTPHILLLDMLNSDEPTPALPDFAQLDAAVNDAPLDAVLKTLA